jgi:hypothetical protein
VNASTICTTLGIPVDARTGGFFAVPPGTYKIPFAILLPPNVPSSMQSPARHTVHWGVEYSICASIDLGQTSSPSPLGSFTAIQATQQLDPTMLRPAGGSNGVTIHPHCCFGAIPLCCVTFGNVILTLETERSGYFIGETVRAFVKVNADGWKEAQDRFLGGSFSIRQHVTMSAVVRTFSATGYGIREYHQSTYVATGFPGVPQKVNNEQLLCCEFVLPFLPPTYVGGGSQEGVEVVKWTYELVGTVELNVPGACYGSQPYSYGASAPIFILGYYPGASEQAAHVAPGVAQSIPASVIVQGTVTSVQTPAEAQTTISPLVAQTSPETPVVPFQMEMRTIDMKVNPNIVVSELD